MITQEQVTEYRNQLEAKKKELLEKIERLSVPKDFGSGHADPEAEEADEAEEFGNRLGIAHELKMIVNEIDEALERISGGDYGVCKSCERPISKEILDAVPESLLCDQCKAH